MSQFTVAHVLSILATIAFASPASAGETKWSQTVDEWLGRYELAIGRYTLNDFTAAQAKRGARCKADPSLVVACPKNGSFFYDSAAFEADGRAHYFSLTLTTAESKKPCEEIGKHLLTKYGTPSYGIKNGGLGYNFPKKRRHLEFGPTREGLGCILSIQAGVRTK